MNNYKNKYSFVVLELNHIFSGGMTSREIKNAEGLEYIITYNNYKLHFEICDADLDFYYDDNDDGYLDDFEDF